MIILVIIGSIALVWGLLTWIAEKKGPENRFEIGNPSNTKKALIIYDPDPFYNLDEQVCRSFAEGLADKGWKSEVVSVAVLDKRDPELFELYVFCANTYNWAPDRAVSNYIKKSRDLIGKKVVAITLGSGSTARSKLLLEKILKEKEMNLIDSKTFWLLKPNDESRTKESNVKIAIELSNDFGKEVAMYLENK